MKVLLIYYSFTQQAERAVREAQRACHESGHEAVLCRVDFADPAQRLHRPLSPAAVKRWTRAAAQAETAPVCHEPAGALDDEPDLILVFSNTWQDSPCVPIRSFLQSEAARVLAGKPFAVLVICRRLWQKNAAAVRTLGEAARGHFLGAQAFTHPGSGAGSLVQTISYLMRSGPPWRRFLGFPLPEYGLSPESLAQAGPFVRDICTQVEAEQRRVAQLEGGHNFRDIGGYRTADGKRVRWGRVYRSGTMAMLTEADQAYMAEIGIRVICDFRSTKERQVRPTRWSESHAVVHWARDHDSSVGELVAAITHPEASAEAMRKRMIAAYRHLPYEQAESYREVFRRVADGDLPLIFHCAAGKDRTGIAAALLLTLLGVPRATVIEDYLLTERFFERGCHLVISDPTSSRFASVNPAIWEPMMRAETVYIEAMFDTLISRHGSIEAYLEGTLGVDAAMRERIRQELLE
jgi:protein-tyrosine phosphatase